MAELVVYWPRLEVRAAKYCTIDFQNSASSNSCYVAVREAGEWSDLLYGPATGSQKRIEHHSCSFKLQLKVLGVLG